MFKLGDRVIMLYSSICSNGYCSNEQSSIQMTREGDRGEIIEIYQDNRYRVKLFNTKNIIGNPVEKWVGSGEFKIDKQYLRNEKINTIFNNSNS